jgi:hypothetical protein
VKPRFEGFAPGRFKANSYTLEHLGDKFGGNGPLFATALHGLMNGRAAVTYIGGVGNGEVLPIYKEAMAGCLLQRPPTVR